MGCDPTFNALVEKVATPVALSALPIRAVPSMNATVPFGTLPSGAAIVAVQLTAFPMSRDLVTRKRV